ncbi:hypothetical protein LCER1_G005136 [Lachnellula cervina]|uniref:Uncharacterized protein n=1 Tax=Lachnellula cervina TaxID=1316786 RepID=A0A7D8Z2H2_9HELO|nr:hypothetical protein LCER1_G005136 [Lachnellula cervina]
MAPSALELEQNVLLQNNKARQTANVYDAVAGRVSSAGFIPKRLIFSSTRDTPSSSTAPVPPEAALFRRKNAPTRFAEDDIYFASDKRPGMKLPESDLLKALHCYVSDFYSRNTTDGGADDWKSLDDTALMALGILMEEAAGLSMTGDLVFAEGEQISDSFLLGLKAQQASSRTPKPTRRLKSRASKKRRLHEPSVNFDID